MKSSYFILSGRLALLITLLLVTSVVEDGAAMENEFKTFAYGKTAIGRCIGPIETQADATGWPKLKCKFEGEILFVGSSEKPVIIKAGMNKTEVINLFKSNGVENSSPEPNKIEVPNSVLGDNVLIFVNQKLESVIR